MVQEDTKGVIPVIISETNGIDVLSFLGGWLVNVLRFKYSLFQSVKNLSENDSKSKAESRNEKKTGCN